MEAEDTVMSDGKLLELFTYPSKQPNVCYELKPYEKHPDMSSHTVVSIARQSAKAQADISFKAGIREVVDLIRQYPIMGIGFQSALDAKLKELGVG